MRLFGHPVHVMLVHFPIGLWPAHVALQLFAAKLPAGADQAAFWLLVAGCCLAWVAALCGAADLVALSATPERRAWRSALTHAVINGTVTAAFTGIAVVEYAAFPAVHHSGWLLAGEIVLLGLLFVGNFFGGAVVWNAPPPRAVRASE